MSVYRAEISGPDRLSIICRYSVVIFQDDEELFEYWGYAITKRGARWLAQRRLVRARSEELLRKYNTKDTVIERIE